MLLQVSNLHIKNGSKTDTHSCPVALALADAVKGYLYCAEFDFIHVHTSTRLIKYTVPKIVKQFMKDFLRGMDVQPFSVELIEIETEENSQ